MILYFCIIFAVQAAEYAGKFYLDFVQFGFSFIELFRQFRVKSLVLLFDDQFKDKLSITPPVPFLMPFFF